MKAIVRPVILSISVQTHRCRVVIPQVTQAGVVVVVAAVVVVVVTGGSVVVTGEHLGGIGEHFEKMVHERII